jgi:hypothetical protein
VPIVFDQEIHVHYGQFYIESRADDFFEGLTESLGGQSNGLCGAAVPGLLFLKTGLHTGQTRVTVEVIDAPALIADEWEDVVAASFRPATEKVALVQWAGEASWPLPLAPIDYRVRYSATGMDRARERDTRLAGERCWTDTCYSYGPLRELQTRSSAKPAIVRPTGTLTPAHCHRHSLRGSERRPTGGNGRPRRRSAGRRPRPPRHATGAAGCRTNASGG